MGIKNGVLFLYFKYSWPKRFPSSTSSIVLARQIIQAQNKADNTNNAGDPAKMENPRSHNIMPRTIGLREYAYGPVMTKLVAGILAEAVPPPTR